LPKTNRYANEINLYSYAVPKLNSLSNLLSSPTEQSSRQPKSWSYKSFGSPEKRPQESRQQISLSTFNFCGNRDTRCRVTSPVESPQVFIKNQTKLGPRALNTELCSKNFGPGNCIKDLFRLIMTLRPTFRMHIN